jgi:hypothetical protein
LKRLLLLVVAWSACVKAVAAAVTWEEALQMMPMPREMALGRDNAVELLLAAFRSNGVAKALVILPGVADDFYLIHRDAPPLNLRASNLLEAVSALTNATAVRATFRAPFLLLHTERDALEPACVVEAKSVAARLKSQGHLPHVRYSDTHWERIQPTLQRALGVAVRPDGLSSDAWHFHRHNLVGWNLSDWELLNAFSLADGTTIVVQKRAIAFQVRGTP